MNSSVDLMETCVFKKNTFHHSCCSPKQHKFQYQTSFSLFCLSKKLGKFRKKLKEANIYLLRLEEQNKLFHYSHYLKTTQAPLEKKRPFLIFTLLFSLGRCRLSRLLRSSPPTKTQLSPSANIHYKPLEVQL